MQKKENLGYDLSEGVLIILEVVRHLCTQVLQMSRSFNVMLHGIECLTELHRLFPKVQPPVHPRR